MKTIYRVYKIEGGDMIPVGAQFSEKQAAIKYMLQVEKRCISATFETYEVTMKKVS